MTGGFLHTRIGALEGRLRARQILRQRIGEPEIRQHGRLIGSDLERGLVIALRVRVASDLIEHGTLCGEDAPVRMLGHVRAAQHVERLLIVADVGERPPIGAEHFHVPRVPQRSLLQHRHRLRALAALAQRLRVMDRNLGIVRIGVVAFTPGLRRAAPFLLARRSRGTALGERGAGGGRAHARAASERTRKAGQSHDREQRSRGSGKSTPQDHHLLPTGPCRPTAQQ